MVAIRVKINPRLENARNYLREEASGRTFFPEIEFSSFHRDDSTVSL